MVNEHTNLSIKCVQLVESLWKHLCITVGYTRPLLFANTRMCTNSAQSTFYPPAIHSIFLAYSICFMNSLYTVSTEPIITTIFFIKKNRKDI